MNTITSKKHEFFSALDSFQRLFLDLVEQIHAKTHYTKLVIPLKIIDSSTLPLHLTNHKWAKFGKIKVGVKLHLRLVFMEKGISYPEKAIITTAKEHDRGYLDYKRFDRMTDDGYFFLSRLRKNAVMREVYDFKRPENTDVFQMD